MELRSTAHRRPSLSPSEYSRKSGILVEKLALKIGDCDVFWLGERSVPRIGSPYLLLDGFVVFEETFEPLVFVGLFAPGGVHRKSWGTSCFTNFLLQHIFLL